jgi:hypothetical protein
MAYTDQFALLSHATFPNRVKIAMVQSCLNVVGEAKGALARRDWQKRHRWATGCLNAPDDYIDRVVLAVASHQAATPASAIADDAEDSEISSFVDAVIGDLAGVGQEDWL